MRLQKVGSQEQAFAKNRIMRIIVIVIIITTSTDVVPLLGRILLFSHLSTQSQLTLMIVL